MSVNRTYPDPDAISEEEQEHDSRIGAKMHLFLERMIRAAREEEGIDEERAVDLMLCTAVRFYAERLPTNPTDIAVMCRSIAEEVLSGADGGDRLH
ncbi:hypothetical protein [Chromatocurvus halotolerans]|uniref:Uncharacterized protein n=1 Tax=Chromatocurvus halotolerans TaxID=1132028 RepID=A0A4R2KRU6_9GAMM|nr:hypothetical protein [Chromatocurvus halotolerans]TCO73699.1 hypothetical protein EV688_11515 [Chromatocurvus halotolerans]